MGKQDRSPVIDSVKSHLRAWGGVRTGGVQRWRSGIVTRETGCHWRQPDWVLISAIFYLLTVAFSNSLTQASFSDARCQALDLLYCPVGGAWHTAGHAQCPRRGLEVVGGPQVMFYHPTDLT